jgi:hypothetical protein
LAGISQRVCQRHHHVDLRSDHFSRGSEGLGRSLVYPSMFDNEILPLGESELAQFSKERRIARSKSGASRAEPRNPIRAIGALCCARAAIGHAAAPPTSEMKSRRLMPALTVQDKAWYQRKSRSGNSWVRAAASVALGPSPPSPPAALDG